jgi:hypothetical protein
MEGPRSTSPQNLASGVGPIGQPGKWWTEGNIPPNCHSMATSLSPLYLPSSRPSAIQVRILILAKKPTHSKRIQPRIRRILERERRQRSHLWIIHRLQKFKPHTPRQIIPQSDASRQIRTRVQRAGAFPGIECGHEGVFEDPVGTIRWAGEASGDAVAGGFDAVFEVEVDFCYDAGYVDALEVWVGI